MALNPNSEQQDINLPDDYKQDHPDEHPGQWGWHGEWGRTSRVGGFIVIAILLLMITATHYNGQGTLWLTIFAVAVFLGLLWDHHRRKNAWRE